MASELRLGDITVDVILKDIKNVHLSVYPPTGRVRIAAPRSMTLETIRLFAISKLGWIKRQQRRQREQERETPREYIERESHYLWGRRYLLRIADDAPRGYVALSHRHIELGVPEGSDAEKRQAVLDGWYREELRAAARERVSFWEDRLAVRVDRLFIQRMKTKWGGSSPERGTIRLNLELVKKDAECLDYVVLHEMAHFIVPNHSAGFVALLDRHMPNWRNVRKHLNDLPLLSDNNEQLIKENF
ncbi:MULTISPECIES: M48 family metallopeptidase [unclassified Sulfitobacter]|uniref:M48 family metallopeptidase n=1 Tax=unclassified Sulfitobacter TaxID=196795 RepID=UPI0007C22D68|nr:MULTISPECIES: SprT family zinc-dependent metalloprotease [unclassified Sulfitobacter]KZX94248.1 metal-dependent hydrolase [Sulfitobacter sp. HI0021]KZX95375.1 metal-dependent hydrolase [Sulfitobacter sp. HI0027]KZZ03319.1 metal-dependent hydrolase [Sulfitobacter sp. HI0076]